MAPDTLHLALRERVVEYDPELRRRWRDPEWWDADEWRGFLPRAEWHRVGTKFRTQAITSGNHFVEVLQMRELESQGISWRYEGYDFFKDPSPTATHTLEGVALIKQGFPIEDIERLQAAAAMYRYREGRLPATPDLFAYRHEGQRLVPVGFVELKHGRAERVSNLQLLGLALIRDILRAEIEIVRYIENGLSVAPRQHEVDWPRRPYIPDAPTGVSG